MAVDLQEGYERCASCGHEKASVFYRAEVPETRGVFWGISEKSYPEYLSITCLGCHRKVHVKPGTVKLTGPYIGA